MKLLWHIVRKDARLLRWPWVVWLASFFIVAAWLRFSAPSDLWPWDDFTLWISTLGLASVAAMILQLLLGAVLAGFLVLEDPLAEPNAFWQTRPLAPARLLAAKLCGIALLLVVAPLVVLLPVWLSAGFGPAELSEAAWEVTKTHALAATIGLVAGLLTRNLAQFFFVALGLGLVVVIALLPRLPGDRFETPHTIYETRSTVLLLLCGAGALLALSWGVARRQLRMARILISVTAVAVVGGRFAVGQRHFVRPDERVLRDTRTMGELPLRAGAELKVGAGRVQVLAVIAAQDGRQLHLRIKEDGVWQARRDGVFVSAMLLTGAGGDWLAERFAAGDRGELAVEYGYSLVVGDKVARVGMSRPNVATTARYGLMRSAVIVQCELPEGLDARRIEREGTAKIRVLRTERKVISP